MNLLSGNLVLDLTELAQSLLVNINTIDIAGSGANTLSLDKAAVDRVSDATHELHVRANLDDTVNTGLGWTLTGTRIADGLFFRVLEQGTTKLLLNGPSDWQNPVNPLDVNANGSVEPLDVLIIINELNAPKFRDAAGRLVDAASLPLFPDFYFDTNRDGFLVPLDALVIINFLNSFNGGLEGEDALPAPSGPFDPAFADLTAFVAQTETRPNVVTRVSRDEGTAPIARPALPTSRQSSPVPRQLTSAEYAVVVDELLADLEADTLFDELGT
ncbi:MAG: hypothetical protein HYV60_07090 [Planctomycetia bacterium]|nr:hypothetical protein [Planctomycetia bacterium]